VRKHDAIMAWPGINGLHENKDSRFQIPNGNILLANHTQALRLLDQAAFKSGVALINALTIWRASDSISL
jgi:hypothetical protein